MVSEPPADLGQREQRVRDLDRGNAAAGQLGRAQEGLVRCLGIVGSLEQPTTDRQRKRARPVLGKVMLLGQGNRLGGARAGTRRISALVCDRGETTAVRGQLFDRTDHLEAPDHVLLQATELAGRGVASIEIAYSLLALAGIRQRLGCHDEAGRIYEEARKAVGKCEAPGILNERLARGSAAPTRAASASRPDDRRLSP